MYVMQDGGPCGVGIVGSKKISNYPMVRCVMIIEKNVVGGGIDYVRNDGRESTASTSECTSIHMLGDEASTPYHCG